jgi:cytochrome c oxidase subunit II
LSATPGERRAGSWRRVRARPREGGGQASARPAVQRVRKLRGIVGWGGGSASAGPPRRGLATAPVAGASSAKRPVGGAHGTTRPGPGRALGGAALALLLGACTGGPSLLDPRGVQAERTAVAWWSMLVVGGIIWAGVMLLLLLALVRRRPRGDRWQLAPDYRHLPRGGLALIVAGGVALPVVVLTALSFVGSRVLAAQVAPDTAPTLAVEVTAHQFWWEVHYPAEQILTANEVHVPVGQPVRLMLRSADVIHSFWVPQLAGKTDLIPGKTNAMWLRADTPGVYRGQCAEYCGLQHAHMAFLVIADPPDQYAAWVAAQQRPAAQPADPSVQAGAQVFARQGCITCHAIRYGAGDTGGKVGPDLTHLASRATLGAGTLDNNRGNLGGWIENSQAIKPGNPMPPMPMDGTSLQALLAYLESLQ